jgi:hypothetical protein
MTGKQPRGNRALVADGDGVRENEPPFVRIGLLVEIAGLDFDADLVQERRHHPILQNHRPAAASPAATARSLSTASDTDSEYVAGRGVQNRILGEVHQDGKAMTLAAGDAYDLRLYITCLHSRGGARHAEFAGQRSEALSGSLQQLILYLHRGHQRFAHWLYGDELHDVQQFDLGAKDASERLRAAPDDEAVFRQIDY